MRLPSAVRAISDTESWIFNAANLAACAAVANTDVTELLSAELSLLRTSIWPMPPQAACRRHSWSDALRLTVSVLLVGKWIEWRVPAHDR